MKKIGFALLIMVCALGVNAQNNLVDKKANELAKLALIKMQANEINLQNGIGAKSFPILESYFSAKAAAVSNLTNEQILEKDAAGEFATIVSKRDEAFKNILSAQQYTQWINISAGLIRTIEQVK
jgi:hypothetical protein